MPPSTALARVKRLTPRRALLVVAAIVPLADEDEAEGTGGPDACCIVGGEYVECEAHRREREDDGGLADHLALAATHGPEVPR